MGKSSVMMFMYKTTTKTSNQKAGLTNKWTITVKFCYKSTKTANVICIHCQDGLMMNNRI